MDFLDSLKNIKEQMKSEPSKQTKKASEILQKSEKKASEARLNEESAEMKHYESVFDREERLKDEFMAYIANEDIKKI